MKFILEKGVDFNSIPNRHSPKIKKRRNYVITALFLSAHERNRTFTPLRMADFESAASTNSATWATS